MNTICEHVGAAFDAKVKLGYKRNYPVTMNDAAETLFAASVARHSSARGTSTKTPRR